MYKLPEIHCLALALKLLLLLTRGLNLVPDEEVIAMYDGSHVPLEQMSDFYGKVKVQMAIFLCSKFP